MTLDAGAQAVADDCRAEVHRRAQRAQGRPRVSKGPVSLSRGKSRHMLAALIDLSRLSMRWLLVTDLRAAQKDAAKRGRVAPTELGPDALNRITGNIERELSESGDPMPRPRQRWVDVPRVVAIALAVEEMQEREPEEAKRYEELRRRGAEQVADAAKRGARARKAADMELKRATAVFLSRFFPVPAPELLVPGFWTETEVQRIGRKIAEAIASQPAVAEPAWFPDGWRESMAAFGQEKVNNDG